MIVADTCVWVEWIAGTLLGKRFAPSIRDTAHLLVPTIVQLELRKWALREIAEDEIDRVMAGTRLGHVVPLTEPLAFHAADIARQYRLATADAIIYATALAHDAKLLTSDKHFADLPGVQYVAKAI